MSDKKKDRTLRKLTIHSFADRNFTKEDTKRMFVAPINPESFTKNLKVEHDVKRAHGKKASEVKFKSTAPEELRLEFVLDGTATMEGYYEEYRYMPVHDQVDKFLKCAYDFKAETHRPRFLIVFWGSEINFRCVLANLDINYTLFHPDGSPLRAKLTATFLNFIAKEERLAQDRPSSPDLTHYRKIEQADRLDLLSFNIYNDPKYLLQVAKANALSSIRNVRAGKELYFPPFDKNEI